MPIFPNGHKPVPERHHGDRLTRGARENEIRSVNDITSAPALVPDFAENHDQRPRCAMSGHQRTAQKRAFTFK
jgi:hypothetical protein